MRTGSCGHSCRAMLRDEIFVGRQLRRGARDDRFAVGEEASEFVAHQLIGHRMIAVGHDILPGQYLEPADFDESFAGFAADLALTAKQRDLVRDSRSEARSVGRECVRTGRTRWVTSPKKQT